MRNRKLVGERLEPRHLLAITVTTEQDVVDAEDGLVSLREAIETANAMTGTDDIVFDFGHDGPAVILLDQGELEITEAVTITGQGQDLLTIDAQDQSRIFNISATTGDITIARMTLTNGLTTGNNQGGRVDHTYNGGAIRSLTTGDLALLASSVSKNRTTGLQASGGGVFALGGITLTDSTVSNNSTNGYRAAAGGIAAIGDVTLTGSIVSDNVTRGEQAYGGGVFALGDVTLTRSTVSGNGTYGDRAPGGGIHVYGSNLTLYSSTVSGNETAGAFSDGGGVAADDSGGGYHALTIINSTVTNNHTIGASADGGGAAGGPYGTVSVSNSTITGNSSTGRGGGVYGSESFGFSVGVVTIENSIIAGNNNAGGSSPDLWPGNGVLTIKHSLIGHSSGTDLVAAPVGSPDANGNLVGSNVVSNGVLFGAIDPLVNPLSGIEGTTQVHTLKPGSPAIDAGNPVATPGEIDIPLYDQRGQPYSRVADCNSVARIDMGAVERHDLSVEILAVASPTTNPVDTVSIQFSRPVSGFDLGDLVLSLNGGGNRMTSGHTLSTTDNETFVLGGIAEIAAAAGYYTLRLISAESEIVDASGCPLGSGNSTSWAMGRAELGLTVNTTTDESDGRIDDGDISLRDAIAAAAPGETIGFDTSLNGETILLHLGELSITRSLTIDATSLPARLVVSASGNDPTPNQYDGKGSRIFAVDDGNPLADSPVAIRGLTLTGGDVTTHGGAIRSTETLLIGFARIIENSATFGGGIDNSESVTMTSSTISDNRAMLGGGLRSSRNVIAGSSMISGNTANYGGGIHALGDVTLTASTVSDNWAMFFGGGLHSSRNVIASSSTISGNTADHGGGIHALGDVTLTSSTVSGNSVAIDGGGIHASAITIFHSTISGNSAEREGGGIWIDGGGLAPIVHSIVAANMDGGTAPDLQVGTALVALAYSLIGDSTGTNLIEAPIGLPDAVGNVIGGPVQGVVDAKLGALANNGGPIHTHALLPDSPAIDTGDPTAMAGVGSVPLHDQRGEPYTRVSGGRIDKGAFEFVPLAADFDKDGDTDGDDFLLWQAGFGIANGANQQQGDADEDGDVDGDDLLLWQAEYDLGTVAAQESFLLSGHKLGSVRAARLRPELMNRTARDIDPTLRDRVITDVEFGELRWRL